MNAYRKHVYIKSYTPCGHMRIVYVSHGINEGVALRGKRLKIADATTPCVRVFALCGVSAFLGQDSGAMIASVCAMCGVFNRAFRMRI